MNQVRARGPLRSVWIAGLAALSMGLTPACGDEGGAAAVDAADDAGALDDGGKDAAGGDVALADAAEGDDGAADVEDGGGADADADADAGPEDVATGPDYGPARARAIGGVSMGAAAVNIALRHPELFGVVGGLGGYVEIPYMLRNGIRMQLGGFCSLEVLEANVEGLNDPAADPATFCGPVAPREELEIPQDFNHFHFDTDGTSTHRVFYRRVFQNMTMAFGNFLTDEHAETPYLPAGVDRAWFEATAPKARCQAPKAVEGAAAFGAEHNPEGQYAVLPVCDGNPEAAGMSLGDFDPGAANLDPIDVALFVDINGNGRRDFAEPLMFKAWERFEDVGADGCPSAREDGLGGCLPEGASDATEADPNGDDYHWWANPEGGEANGRWDEGEPFEDLGLDGLPAEVVGEADRGEGNGVWDATEALTRAAEYDARLLVEGLGAEALAGMDLWLDSGIRDALHAGVSTRHVVGALRARGEQVSYFEGFTEAAESVFPAMTDETFMEEIFSADFSQAALGRHVYVEYGNPDATPQEIADNDGKHVGSAFQAVGRLLSFLSFAAWRLGEPDLEPGQEAVNPLAQRVSFYSQGLKARRAFTVALPPGYDDPANAERTYPVIFFLHGLGQSHDSLGPSALATNLFMQNGQMPKAIMVMPDGSCCDVDTETGLRECACRKGPDGTRLCMDPACQGEHGECEERAIPGWRLVEECNEGSLFYNLVTNRWGEPRGDLRYEDSVVELVHEVDRLYRTRAASE